MAELSFVSIEPFLIATAVSIVAIDGETEVTYPY